MSTQNTTPPRAGLVPQVITDVNGFTKTVWVRPEDLVGGSNKEKTLNDLKPAIKQKLAEGFTHLRMGEKQNSLRHTSQEKLIAADRGYGTPKLREAAARKFEMEFGIALKDSPPVVLNDEQLYDYVARGLTVEQSHEFAKFGVDANVSHPKLDAEYAFVAGPKVAKQDLRNQEKNDSPIRRAEFQSIKKTARALQDMEVSPHIAAKCIGNGLRWEHLNDKSHNIGDVISMSAENNVESEKFRSFQEKSGTIGGAKRTARDMGLKTRRRIGNWAKRWAKRQARKLWMKARRRTNRVLGRVFLPWRTRW